ncbi:glycosyltransferase family 4 protein [Bacillus weihaiensis]|uniref:Glycosyltransferase subfamily 4-like N-terminal domain-containing protein n=1 Tax=Bacillus weihaiensis TaxID=1547283 RepID=A0A1L3MMI8_9BACI|nr:glycosyltransferase family 4 protein [Bacillus weihaiensis]APH03559.1 hypothetical protein A9C19_01650 [Bacillus weihaiensis]
MKILYLSWFHSGEGSQVHANEFMHAMREIGNEIIPIELSLRNQNYLENIKLQKSLVQAKSSYPKLVLKEIKSLLLNIPRILRLLKLYKKHKPDSIINRYSIYDISAIIVGKILKIPVVYEVNGSVIYERDIEGRYYLKLARWFEKFIFKHANVVTVVSNELLNYFKENEYDTTKSIVIPNGVDIDKFTLNASAPEQLKQINEKWANKTVLGFLGSLKSWHGVERIIDLIPSLIKENPNIRFLIIGDGNERERLEEKIKNYEIEDYVFITGFLNYQDVPGAINLFDIALAPYNNIDFFYFSPLKVFEYMAMAKPVIAPRLGQCQDLIQDSHNGFLLDENTNEDLKQKILLLAKDESLIQQMGANAREFIKNHYTWTVNAEKIDHSIKNSKK